MKTSYIPERFYQGVNTLFCAGTGAAATIGLFEAPYLLSQGEIFHSLATYATAGIAAIFSFNAGKAIKSTQNEINSDKTRQANLDHLEEKLTELRLNLRTQLKRLQPELSGSEINKTIQL